MEAEHLGFRSMNVLLGHARGHGPQRFGRVNVFQGCVGATRTETGPELIVED